MKTPYKFLPLALLTLLVACGVSSDSKTHLRPAPPVIGTEAQPPDSDEAETVSDPNPWYEHFDLSEVVVRIGPNALARASEPATRSRVIRPAPRPTSTAYSRRLQTLQQDRDRLLRENAALSMKLALQAAPPVPEEIGTLKTQLGHLSAQQRLVTTRTQTIEVEHQALLAMLEQTTAQAEVEADN